MAIALGDISLRHVNLLVDTAQQLGINTEPVCKKYSLSAELRQQPHARISIPRFMRLGHELIQSGQCPELGLIAGAKATPSLLGITGLTAACAPSLEDALGVIATYELLSSKNARGQSRVRTDKSTLFAEFYSISPYNEFNLFIVDFALSAQLAILRHISPTPIQPKDVFIEFPEPDYSPAYENAFQTHVRFSQHENTLSFQRQALQIAPRMANIVAFHECRSLCEAQLKAQQKNLTFLDRVMNEISPLLHSPELSLEAVAERIELPVWTLQRKLKAENSSFRALVDQTRHELALVYLKDPQYSLGEIAYLLGFAHSNAFYRAFSRWENKSPGQYRLNSQSAV